MKLSVYEGTEWHLLLSAGQKREEPRFIWVTGYHDFSVFLLLLSSGPRFFFSSRLNWCVGVNDSTKYKTKTGPSVGDVQTVYYVSAGNRSCLHLQMDDALSRTAELTKVVYLQTECEGITLLMKLLLGRAVRNQIKDHLTCVMMRLTTRRL